jgi:hypothetical protein
MIDRHVFVDGDAESNLLERRWFAALGAARTLQSECDVLREIMDHAEAAWRRARARLDGLERLRDALGEELAALDGQKKEELARHTGLRAVMSAA